MILYGRNIGKGSIIVAGAVVTKDEMPGSIVAWCTVKVIGNRIENSIEETEAEEETRR